MEIDVRKLITQSEYAKLKKISRQRVNQLVKAKELKTVQINGSTLIILP